MRSSFLSAAMLATAGSLAAQAPAPRVTEGAPCDSVTLESVRADVWMAWLRNDTTRLKAILAPELVTASGADSLFHTLGETLAQSAEYRKAGGKFVGVSFTATRTHWIGDVAVMFSRYRPELEAADGTRRITRGRATEVFARRDGRWVHTSWHLDRTD